MGDYSWKELMAVVFSREIKDKDKITSGAHTEIFFAATMLAQKTHAPNMKLQLGGGVALCNVGDIDVSELPKTSTGYELIRYAKSVHDHADTYCFMARRAATGITRGERFQGGQSLLVCRQILRRRHPGGQVGQYQHDRPRQTGEFRFRGPGTIGINDIAVGVNDTYVFLTAHDKRRLVEKVDSFASGQEDMPGQRVLWRRTEMDRHAEMHLRLDPNTFEARLAMLFPGVTLDDVRANTGFEVKTAKKVQTVEPPTPRARRPAHEVDRTGVLRHKRCKKRINS